MDILALCGSPRKNRTTHSMLKAVLEGAAAESEILWPAFMNIGHCTGCRKCKTTTPGKCWQDDDMHGALEKLLAARALIIASPTYFGNVPGPLKNFIDRSIPTSYTGRGEPWMGAADHGTRPCKARPALILVCSGGGDHEKTAAAIRLVLEYYEYAIAGEYVEPMGGAVISRDEFPDIYQELFDLGKKLGDRLRQS
jgi:multimeric flavodoxin WrbA